MIRKPEMKRHFSMLREFRLADWFTLGNAFCGTGAVFAAMRFLQDGEPRRVRVDSQLTVTSFQAAVLAAQIDKLKRLRAERDQTATDAALEALTNGARGDANLLELAVRAARAKATVGEISDALEAAFGRHVATVQTVSGVYAKEAGRDPRFARARDMVATFVENDGGPPRILIAKLGQDGHDRGQKVVATGYGDIGFDVTAGSLFQTPAEAARDAVEKNVHAVGASSLAAGHLTLVPELRAELARLGREDIMIVVGGVIPPSDVQPLLDMGAAAVYPPGSVIADTAADLIEKLNLRLGYAQPAPAETK